MSSKRSARGGAADDTDEDDDLIVTDEHGNVLGENDEIVGDPLAQIPDDDTAIAAPVEQVRTQTDDDDATAALKRSFDALAIENAQLKTTNAQHQEREVAAAVNQHETTKALIETGIHNVKQSLAAAKAVYANSMALGTPEGYAAAADAQELISALVLEGREYQQALDEIAAAPEPKPRQPNPQLRAVQTPTDWADQIINALDASTKAFAEKYRDQLFPASGDQKPFQQVLKLHEFAETRGVKPGTEAYFNLIKTNMGLEDKKAVTTPKAKPSPSRPAIPAAAPGNAGGNNQAPVTVALSAQERAVAKRLGMSPTKYAKHKQYAQSNANNPDYRGPRYSKDDPAMNGGR